MTSNTVIANTARLLLKDIFTLLDTFTALAKRVAVTHPFVVVMLMHDYFRNLYPNDPFIPKKYESTPLANITSCLENSIGILEKIDRIGSYYPHVSSIAHTVDASLDPAAPIHGKNWEKLSHADYVEKESAEVLRKLFEDNGQNVDLIASKRVLDIGCGSGRFSLGLASLGASQVTGIDLGKQGLQIGKHVAATRHLTNVKFIHGDALALPFKNESFDFIFCKGVLHHTGNLAKGLSELYRVLRKGGHAFLYLYGSGGIFWPSRVKMREIAQYIPMDYALQVLDLIGMPSKRYVFADSWYVPIEEHTSREWLEQNLTSFGFSALMRAPSNGDASIEDFPDTPEGRTIWGDGELRYFLKK